MRDSLRNCPEALRLEDVLETNGLVLFSLDVADYPHATRKVASWVLLGMGRLARQIPHMGDTRALLLVDEVGALGSAARHLRGLVGRARESGLAVVLACGGAKLRKLIRPLARRRGADRRALAVIALHPRPRAALAPASRDAKSGAVSPGCSTR